jgi:hypothetical protein
VADVPVGSGKSRAAPPDSLFHSGALFPGSEVEARSFRTRLVVDETNRMVRVAPLDGEQLLSREKLALVENFVGRDDELVSAARYDIVDLDDIVLVTTNQRVIVLAMTSPTKFDRLQDKVWKPTDKEQGSSVFAQLFDLVASSYGYAVCSVDWDNVVGMESRDKRRLVSRAQILGLELTVESPRGVDNKHWLYCGLRRSDRLSTLRQQVFDQAVAAKRRTFAERPKAIRQIEDVAQAGIPPFQQQTNQYTYLGPVTIPYVEKLNKAHSKLPEWCKDERARLVGFRDPDVPQDQRYVPAVDHDGHVVLEDDEQILWRGSGGARAHHLDPGTNERGLAWQLPSVVDLLVTNQRLAFVTASWRGPAPETALWDLHDVGAAATAIAGGPVHAAGQVRWQWPLSVTWTDNRPPDVGLKLFTARAGSEGTSLHMHELVIRPEGTPGSTIGTLIATAVARFRLADDDRWSTAVFREPEAELRRDFRTLADSDSPPATDPNRGLVLPGGMLYGALSRSDLSDRKTMLKLWNQTPVG